MQSFQRITVGRYLLHPEVDGHTQFDNNTIPGLTGVLTGLLSAATDLLPVSDDVKSLMNTVGEAAVSAAVDAVTTSDDPKKRKADGNKSESKADSTRAPAATTTATTTTTSSKPSGGEVVVPQDCWDLVQQQCEKALALQLLQRLMTKSFKPMLRRLLTVGWSTWKRE